MALKSPNEYTVVELKEFLRIRNLDIAGVKAELVQRLTDFEPIIWDSLNIINNREEEEINEENGKMNPNPLVGGEPSNCGSRVMNLTNNLDPQTNREVEFMRREMDLLRREKELLEREMQFLRRSRRPKSENSGESSRSTITNINLRSISDLLNNFSGSDNTFDAWVQKLKWVRQNYSLDDNALKILIPSKLTGRALDWFNSKPEHLSPSVDELKWEMRIIFNQRPNRLSLRREFEKRKWLASEPFSDYYRDKVILANRVPIPEELSY